MTQSRLFVVRHGETEWNTQKRLQGQLDSPLTAVGIEQAYGVAKLVKAFEIESIFSSPIGRAIKTATICAEQLKLKVYSEPSLVERDFGKWQGELFESLSGEPHFEKIFFEVTKHAPPAGEAGTDCGERIKTSLKAIAKNNREKNILIITHGDAIRCLHFMLNGESGCDAYSQYGNGHIFELSYCHDSDELSISENDNF